MSPGKSGKQEADKKEESSINHQCQPSVSTISLNHQSPAENHSLDRRYEVRVHYCARQLHIICLKQRSRQTSIEEAKDYLNSFEFCLSVTETDT